MFILLKIGGWSFKKLSFPINLLAGWLISNLTYAQETEGAIIIMCSTDLFSCWSNFFSFGSQTPRVNDAAHVADVLIFFPLLLLPFFPFFFVLAVTQWQKDVPKKKEKSTKPEGKELRGGQKINKAAVPSQPKQTSNNGRGCCCAA